MSPSFWMATADGRRREVSPKKDKKDDEIPVADKEALKHAEEKAKELRAKESDILKTYADQTPLVRQLVDLALLSNNMLKGEALSKFIKRSVEML